MKRLTQIFQGLVGVGALIITPIVALGRLACSTVKGWRKKLSPRARRVVAAVSIVVAVGVLAIIAYNIYDDKYGRDYYDRALSDNVRLRSFADDRWRAYNCQTHEYTTGRINWVSDVPVDDSLAVYALPHRRGYINANTGRIVIDAEANDYKLAWFFSEGVAAVMKDGKIGFINTQNEVVIPFQYDYSDDCRQWNFGYIFYDGYCAMTNAEGELGLIDHEGRWIVGPTYDEIWPPHESGYRIIIDDGRYGLLDGTFSTVYPVEYESIDIIADGFVLEKDGRRWQVDFEGNTVLPFMFDEMYYLSYPTGYDDCGELTWGLSDYATYEISNRCGIINRKTGEPITPAIYSDIEMLSENLFKVQEYDSYDWYLLDASGNIVNPE